MTNIIHQPNDKLFKLAMAELAVAKEFFNAHLPARILEKIDLKSLKLQKGSFIDEAYKGTEADVLYSVQMGENSAYLYLLCEQQTKVDPWLAFRLLVYTVRIMETHCKQYPKAPLPLVYPFVVYTGEEPWDAPLELFPLFGDAENLAREQLFKAFQLFDVQRTSDNELRQHQLSGLVAFVLKHRRTADFENFLKQFMPWLHEVEILEQPGAFLGRILLRYIIDRSSKGDQELLVQEAQRHLSHELTGEIMTIAQQWEKRGFEKGMTIAHQWEKRGFEKGMTITQQWKEEGLQQGEAVILKRLLQRRFGKVPARYVQRIAKADAQTLLFWSEKIFDAQTLEEIFK